MNRPDAPVLDMPRFEALAEAFGGDLSRWPAEVREDAARLLAATPDAARRILTEAGDLDAALDAWRPRAASAALQDAILAAAPAMRRGLGLAALVLRAGLGAGLAAACAAGVITGVRIGGLDQPPASVDVVAQALSGYEGLAAGDAAMEDAA